MSEGMTIGPRKIIPVYIEDEMKTCYIDYSMSVIVSRALPDVRDGLKPVAAPHPGRDERPEPARRAAPYRKCAKIAGDTSGNYHPHGEQVVYPTLVRMAQDWSCATRWWTARATSARSTATRRRPMRYTEARLTPLAVEMLADLEKNTVDFRPNYDETREEPVVLPGVVPNLLVNGCSGIAVGMATEVPPHNLSEICDAIIARHRQPETHAPTDLLKIVQGPGLPDRRHHLRHAGHPRLLPTGRGLIKMRARVQVEEGRAGRMSLVVTEIPFQVNKASLLEKIADLVREGEDRRHHRPARRVRPRRHAHRHRAQEGRATRRSC